MNQLSRRSFNLLVASLMAAPHVARSASGKVPSSLDHVILGCNDLDTGVEYVYQRTGVRAAAGGVHPGAGTKNALLSLGTLRYLEIIAPDPQQPASTDARHVAELKMPALVGWALHPGDVDAFALKLKSAGLACVGPNPGSRARPNGTTLTWKSLTVMDDRNGVLPFLIEWGPNALHPSVDAPSGCHIKDLWIETPDPDDIETLASKMQLDVQIRKGKALRLSVSISGPKGSMQLVSRSTRLP